MNDAKKAVDAQMLDLGQSGGRERRRRRGREVYTLEKVKAGQTGGGGRAEDKAGEEECRPIPGIETGFRPLPCLATLASLQGVYSTAQATMH